MANKPIHKKKWDKKYPRTIMMTFWHIQVLKAHLEVSLDCVYLFSSQSAFAWQMMEFSLWDSMCACIEFKTHLCPVLVSPFSVFFLFLSFAICRTTAPSSSPTWCEPRDWESDQLRSQGVEKIAMKEAILAFSMFLALQGQLLSSTRPTLQLKLRCYLQFHPFQCDKGQSTISTIH